MTIRQGTNDDLEAVHRISAASLDQDLEGVGELVELVWRAEGVGPRVRLVADAGGSIEGFASGTVVEGVGFLDVIAVDPQLRRRGIATELIEAWEKSARGLGATTLRVGASPAAYAWPGVDVRYTPAVCLLRRHGYATLRVAVNMDLALSGDLAPSSAALDRIAARGVSVRRATSADVDQLGELILRHWHETWRRETRISCEREPATTFVAVQDGTIVGFASHGVYRSAWFGPTATAPELQGMGVGEVLLRLCLQEMQARGVGTAQIGWVDAAIPFYSRVVGARSGRVFWQFEKEERDGEHSR